MTTRNATIARLAILLLLIAAALAVVTQPLVTSTPSTPPKPDPARLAAHVKYLSVDLYPRSFEQFRNLDRAATYIEQEFRAAGAMVSVQDVKVSVRDGNVRERTYRNIIARFGPAAASSTVPLLVIGAHYDSHGDTLRATDDPRGYTRDSHTPGADDNASGVAGLIELAHLLGRDTPASFTRPVELVAYTLEEPPHFRSDNMGSVRHAQALRATGREVALMLALEMIGTFSDAPDSQRYPVPGMSLLYGDRGDYIALVGKLSHFGALRRTKSLMAGASDLSVRSINAPPALPGIDFSDHLSYWQAGYPALMVTDTAFMRTPHYHQAGYTWEKLDYARMARVVQGVYAVVKGY